MRSPHLVRLHARLDELLLGGCAGQRQLEVPAGSGTTGRRAGGGLEGWATISKKRSPAGSWHGCQARRRGP